MFRPRLIAASVQNPNADIDPVRRKYMSLTAKAEDEGDKLARISGGVYYPISQISQIQKAYDDIVGQLRTAYNVTYRSDLNETGPPASQDPLKTRKYLYSGHFCGRSPVRWAFLHCRSRRVQLIICRSRKYQES